MSVPNVMLNAPAYQINITLLLSIVAICLTAMGTIVKIFSRKPKQEETPGLAQVCIKHNEKLTEIEKIMREDNTHNEKLKEVAQTVEREIAVLKTESVNTGKTLDEMKQTNREIASRLDSLLKQLMEWMSS